MEVWWTDVAPACVDPYLRIMPIARMIFDRASVFMNENERDRILDRILYKYNYKKTVTAFRPHAGEFLRRFNQQSGYETYIVTNSHTEPVRDKVQQLGAESPDGLNWLVERVHGSAKKYIIDSSFDQIDENLTLPGLSRPILLRRKHYFDVLDELEPRWA